MGDKKIWFGTTERMAWIPAPAPGVDRSVVKWRGAQQFLNGGQWRRESATGARQHQLTWPVMSGADVRSITAILEGTWGKGPFYYVDPFAQSANALPQWLAAPWLACDDAPTLYGTAKPTQATTPANTYGYPSYGATYAVNGTGKTFRFPVPPNMTAYFGWHGDATGTAVMQANSTTVAALTTTTSTLTNFTLAGGTSGGWVTIGLSGVGTVTIYGMHLSYGTAAPTGNWVKGEGNTGLRLDGDPTITGYSIAGTLDRQGLSANFVETEAWE